MKRKKYAACLFGLLCLAIGVMSQQYELRLVNKDEGMLGVDMRLASGLPPSKDNYVMDIVFGIRWSNDRPADLGNSIVSAFNIKKSGPRSVKDSFYYQAFYVDPVGFSFPVWQMNNTWVEIMSINGALNSPAAGCFEICSTGFDGTTDPNIRVNETDHAPVIYGGVALLKRQKIQPRQPSFRLQPNPATSLLQLSVTRLDAPGELRLRIVDSKGAVHKESFFACGSSAAVNISTASLSNGQYYLVVDQNGLILHNEPFQKQ